MMCPWARAAIDECCERVSRPRSEAEGCLLPMGGGSLLILSLFEGLFERRTKGKLFGGVP